jgi:peptide/nickel transport system ATP-binding protein
LTTLATTTVSGVEAQERDRPILDVKDLHVHYPVKTSLIQRIYHRRKAFVHAVDGISFSLEQGEIFGLVGESGCGKTTTGRAVLRLVDPTSGKITFDGTDITRMKEKRLRPLRTQMQAIFQDPHASLNPAMTIGRAIGHPLKIHGLVWREEDAKARVLEIMEEVGLTPAEQLYDKFPSDLSGGQKQRAAIARAIILVPRLIVADEPVAMLDMSIRARVLELMLNLKLKFNLTYLFITHDLATAKFLCDRIAIMYLGRIVEMGPSKSVYADPKHPYTKALLQAIPVPDPRRRAPKVLPKGEVPDATDPPIGCRFHPRCPAVLPTCGWEGRDFIDFLEARRTDLEIAKKDQAALGSLALWKANGVVAEYHSQHESLRTAIAYVRSMLKEAPTPLARAIEGVNEVDGKLVVRFRTPDLLAPKDVEGRLVECLLY